MVDFDEAIYTIDFKEMDLVFALYLFFGDSDIYINEKFCPEFLEDFEWNSVLKGDDRVVLTPSTRDVENTKYCIRVVSEGYSLFAINAFPLQMNKLLLPFDYPESGNVKTGEVINYKLNIDGA